MGLWDFVALAVVSGCLLEGYKAYTKSKHQSGNLNKIEDRLDALEAKVGNEGLESRVRTLETIVTDSNYQLKKEIDSL